MPPLTAQKALAATPETPATPPEMGAGASQDARFAMLFRAYAPYVQRVMPRMGVAAADVDDTTQEVFLAVYRGLSTFQARSSDKTWIYGICIRVCSNYRRRAHRRRERLHESPPEGDDPRHPERALITRTTLARLDAALQTLPDMQRAAFVLHEVEQLSVKEIAQALDCSKFTVYARLRTAHRRIQAQMGDEHAEEEVPHA